METQINMQEIMTKLIELQKQVNTLQQGFEDTQVSENDVEALKLAEDEHRNNELVSIKDIEKLRKENVSN